MKTVITFFSPSPRVSNSAVGFFEKLFGLRTLELTNSATISCRLNDIYGHGWNWNSKASVCPSSGAVIHFLSPHSGNEVDFVREQGEAQRLELISIHSSQQSSPEDALLMCRKCLANESRRQQYTNSTAEGMARGLVFRVLTSLMGKNPQSSWFFSRLHEGHQPSTLLDLSVCASGSPDEGKSTPGPTSGGRLREVALPYSTQSSSNLLTILSKMPSLSRPLPGLYQMPGDTGLILRPLPAATEDMRLSAPSLVFEYDDDISHIEKAAALSGGRIGKIGWRGDRKKGSLILAHPDIAGLDIRVASGALSSFFDEAQESLLAGSFDKLQNANVTSDGRSNTTDENIGKKDCWAEFRHCATRPSGFVNQMLQKPADRQNTVAKPPSPYD